MLTFNLFQDFPQDNAGKVTIYPPHVESVRETERRPSYGFWQKCAVITTVTGEKFTVYDESRNVAAQIYEALEN